MSARAGVAAAAALAGGAALLGVFWRRGASDLASHAREQAAHPKADARAPREPQHDGELAAMLSELLRTDVAPPPADELERLDSARAAPPQQATPQPPDAAALMLGPERVPNVARVDGLSGAFVSGAWPDGSAMFEARQARDEDGAWRLDGSWRAWYPGGQLEELGGYAQGFEHGAWSWWYSSGAPLARGEFDEGARVGHWTFWHPNGVVIGEGAYVGGWRSGRWVFRGADGRVREEFSGEYEEGQRVGP